MEKSAQTILRHRGVQFMCGVPSEVSETLVSLYLHGELAFDGNTCDQERDNHHCVR